MSKVMIALAAGAGYVLGARAGTERYEQIRTSANRYWQDPRAQDKVAQTQLLVKQKAPEVQEKVTDAAAKARAKVKGRSDSEDDSGNASPSLRRKRP